jgi:peroxidase
MPASKMLQVLGLLIIPWVVLATPWPYTRTFTNTTVPADEHDEHMPNMFIDWLRGALAHDPTGEVARVFVNETIPTNIQSFDDLGKYIAHKHVEPHALPKVVWDAMPSGEAIPHAQQVAALFSHLQFTLDPNCTDTKEKYWYRQPDGHCNWLKAGQSGIGATSYPRSRDFGQTTYADGISAPREGPNPRTLSNTFFKVFLLFLRYVMAELMNPVSSARNVFITSTPLLC